MVTFIVRRLLAAVLVLVIVAAITFAIFFLLPRLAGQSTYQLAAQYVGRNPIPSQVHDIEAKLGLNEPILVQFGRFLKGIVAGETYSNGPSKTYCPAPCLGYSWRDQQPVWPLLVGYIPVTLSLAGGAAVIWLVSGVATGVTSALRRGSFFDRAAMGTALLGVSLPIFFTGQLLLLLFSYQWQVFPGGVQYVSPFSNPLEWAKNLILPWIALAFLYAALYARLTRAGMLETMQEDYIRTARAKGLHERTVIVKHGLRAALTPVLTIFGLDLGLLLGGAVVTEATFSLHGLGYFTLLAINNSDLPEIMGVVLLAAFFIVIANLIVDILYATVDPKVRI